MTKDKWIRNAVNPKNRGILRDKLGAKPGKPIPAKKLERAAHSSDPTLKKEATLARNFRGFRKGIVGQPKPKK